MKTSQRDNDIMKNNLASNITPPIIQISIGDNSPIIFGDNNYINASSVLDKALNVISEQHKLLSKSQEQIDRLLSLLEDTIS